MFNDNTQRTTKERGFTFLVVIWTLSILVVIALAFSASVGLHLKVTRNAIDNGRAEAFADSGVALAVLDLLAWRARPTEEARFPRDGRSVRCSLDNNDWLRIVVEDEAGKVDLNAADERLIGAALLAAGVAADDAPSLAARIMDYRDSDSIRRPLGAEAEEYRDQGRAGPKNMPFDVLEEVEQVLGAPVGLAEALRAFATVYTAQVTIDVNLAHRRLLAALSNRRIDADDAASLIEGLSGKTSGLQSRASSGRVFRVIAEARTAQGAVFVREAVVEFLPEQSNAHIFRRWRRALAPLDGNLVEKTAPISDFDPC
jgi:general secretion pathway protein K